MRGGSWKNRVLLEVGRFDMDGGVELTMIHTYIDIQKCDFGGGGVLGELDGIVAVEAFKELYNVILGLPIRLIVPCGFHSNAFLKIFLFAGEELVKKVSAMNYFAYRLMIRANEDNNILRCRQLFHQYIVDMYVKIESERLRYIKFNLKKLRSEEYIHLRDAIIGNVDSTNDINNIDIYSSIIIHW